MLRYARKVWTVEPEAVREAAGIAVSLAARAEPELMASIGGATTVKLAEAVAPVPSSLVESVVELFFVPAVVPVTLTLIVQFAFAARAAAESEIEVAPATALIVPPQVPV